MQLPAVLATKLILLGWESLSGLVLFGKPQSFLFLSMVTKVIIMCKRQSRTRETLSCSNFLPKLVLQKDISIRYYNFKSIHLSSYFHLTHVLFIHLFNFIFFLAALGLHCCTQIFSICRKLGLLQLWCMGFSLCWLLLLPSTVSRAYSSVVVAHRLSCSVACGIVPDQGLNQCPCIVGQIINHWTTREVSNTHF